MITGQIRFNQSQPQFEKERIKPSMAKAGLKLDPDIDLSRPVKVEIRHGRWLGLCECGGAEVLWEEGKFMCFSCWNAASKHHYRLTEFPAERKEIETILEARPLPNRNWQGESVEALQVENDAHKEELL